MDSKLLLQETEKILSEGRVVTEQSIGAYKAMQYPKYFPFIRFNVKQFLVEDFGHVLLMDTKACMGMYLTTMVFTPGSGINLPFLLIDSMSFLKKRAVFVEYYDCGKEEGGPETLVALARQYDHLPNYKEKKAWYTAYRTSYSLIKGNTKEEEPQLVTMMLSEIKAYMALCDRREKQTENNRPGLRAFRERMILEGNPSSEILIKVLGEEGYRQFYREIVIPI